VNQTEYNEQDVRQTMEMAWLFISEGCEYRGEPSRNFTRCSDPLRSGLSAHCSFFFCKKIEILRKMHAGVGECEISVNIRGC
jgi:hypothetical protein